MLNIRCPRCGAPMVKAIAWNNAESEFWYKCSRAPKCNSYYNSFKPLPHQKAVLESPAKFILNAGGFGSAKTYVCRQLIYKQAFMSPRGLILVGANVSSQYEQTIKKELEADIPKEFVKNYSTQKQTMELHNGCRIIYRPFDDPDKIRSMNLSAWFIIEGSEVNPDTFTQLKSRLRNMASAKLVGRDKTGKPIYDYYRGIGYVESNPDAGWIKSEMLEKSHKVRTFGTVCDVPQIDKTNADPAIETFISGTDCNPYLPKNYIRDLCAGKPQWWIERYIYGSFAFANGLVFPGYDKYIIPSFDPPPEWQRLVAHDPGLSDPNAFVCAAIDKENGVVHIYRDKQYEGMGVDKLVDRWNKEIVYDISPYSWYTQPLMDGKMFGRRDRTSMQTLDGMWAQYGVFFKAAHIPIKDRIWRATTYLQAGKIRIHDCCENLLRELKTYKWRPQKLGVIWKEEPVDKDNHSVDCFEWILMELPENPAGLVLQAFSGDGTMIGGHKYTDQELYAMHVFSDDEERPEWTMEGDYQCGEHYQYS